jgi:hypothetical protein
MPSESRARRDGLRLAAWLLAAVTSVSGAAAQSTISREEALGLVFPGAEIRDERVFLTDRQRQEAAALAGVPVTTALVARYIATDGNRIVGRAYVDTHVVRSKRESLLVSLTPDGKVRRVDVTAFLEPAEYQAPRAWIEQYRDRSLTPDLSIQRAIRPIAGATLTARATNEAVRRVLAIDRVLRAAATPEGVK